MDVIEKFLHSISYKFPKGYPDMNSPGDVTLLNEIISNITEQPSPSPIVESKSCDKIFA